MASAKNNWQNGAQNYRAFLLRCWQEGQLPDEGEPGESLAWRFALVAIDDEPGAKGFACLEDLFDYLRGHLIQAGRPAIRERESEAVGPILPRLEISKRKDENES